jgi:two-component system sensor histidine kinase BaeS
MRLSLSLKLLVAFLIVGLIGVGFVALFASRTTESEFGRFIFDQYRASFVDQLEEYYRLHGGWDNIGPLFPFTGEMPFAREGPGGRWGGGSTLINENGMVIVAGPGFRRGQRVGEAALRNATPLQVDGEPVGWLIAPREQFQRSPAEALFLDRMNRTLAIGAAGAAVVSLLLGILLARTLTRPIRELTKATRAVAGGDLGQRVTVRSRDELGDLAVSFNLMSAELARARDMRRQMTADIAHELRTPTTLILGHVDAIDDGILPPSSETFDIIREEAGRLGRLIEDLATLSRVETGELSLVRRLVAPGALLAQAVAAHRPLAEKKQISLHVDIEPDLPALPVDPDRMAQVLGNLLNNALRHTPQAGRITLQARRHESGVELLVQDTGPGIAPEDLPRVFERFYRTDKSRQRETGGAGLGLAIARSIVELHGGQIWAESTLGEGTTFLIRLPSSQEAESGR